MDDCYAIEKDQFVLQYVTDKNHNNSNSNVHSPDNSKQSMDFSFINCVSEIFMHELITGYIWNFAPNVNLDEEVVDLKSHSGFCAIPDGSLFINSFRPSNSLSFYVSSTSTTDETEDETKSFVDDGFLSDGL